MSRMKQFMDDQGDDEVPGGDAMQRALSQNYSDPPALVQQGIAHLNDPNNGLNYEQKMEAIVPLLQAKHFGGPPPPGIGSTPKSSGTQGAIQINDTMNHGLLGFFSKITGGMSGARKLGLLNSSAGASGESTVGGAAAGASAGGYAAEGYGGAAAGASAGGDAAFLL